MTEVKHYKSNIFEKLIKVYNRFTYYYIFLNKYKSLLNLTEQSVIYINCIIFFIKKIFANKKENTNNHKTNHKYLYLPLTQVLQLII